MNKRHFFLAVALSLAFSAFAQTPIPMDTTIRYGKLENGLTYYIRHNEYPPQRADFYIVQNVGAILEEDNQNGLAHFLEHMAFNGTKNFPDKTLTNYLETIGVKFGANLNAGTSQDETVYMMTNVPTVRQSVVDTAIWILHDWSGFISLADNEIDKERGVIREEWRRGMTAGRRMMKERNKQMFPNSQYAKRDVIGDTAIINNFKYDELRAYYKKWYRPDLQALIIVGDIDVNQVEASIKRQFADIPAAENPAKRIIYDIPDNTEPIVSIVTDPEANTSNFMLLFKHKAKPDSFKLSEEGYTFSLANNIIALMLNGRFSKMNSDPACPFASLYGSSSNLTRSTDAFAFAAVAKAGKEKLTLETLFQEAQRTKRYGFTQAELDRAKIELLAFYEKWYKERDKGKNNSYVNEYTGNFLEAEPIPGMAWEWEFAQKALAEKIDLAMVNNLVKSQITTENIIVSITASEKNKDKLPTKEAILKMVEEAESSVVEPYKEEEINKPLVKKKPKAGTIVKESRNEEFGTTEWLLSNGIRVIIKPTTFKNDDISLYAFSDGGFSLVKNENDMISANFTDNIVAGGKLGGLTSFERSRILTGKIANVSTDIDGYNEFVKGNSSVKDAETMFQLCYLKFTDVSVDKKAYENYIQKLKTTYANKKDNPNSAFSDTIKIVRTNYNPRTIIMTPEKIENISVSKAYSIYKERFKNPADFTFVLVGTINLDSIKPLVTTYLGGLKTSAKRESWTDNNIRNPKGKIDKVWTRDMKVGKSSVCLMYNGGMEYNFENSVAAGALADVLRLRYTESIREDEGGTYGVGVTCSLFNRPQEKIRLEIKFDTDPQKADRLIELAQKELDTIRKNGVRADDLDKVKKNLLKKFAEGQKENSWWRARIVSYERVGFNYLSDYERIVNNLSSEKLQQTLETLLAQENCIKFLMNPTDTK